MTDLSRAQVGIKKLTLRADQGDGVNWCEWYFSNISADRLELVIGLLRGAEEHDGILALAESRERPKTKPRMTRQIRGAAALR